MLLIFLYAKNRKIYSAYVSKHNSNHEKHYLVILWIIPNGEGWYYLAVKETINIIKRNNSNKKWWFLLLELSSFF